MKRFALYLGIVTGLVASCTTKEIDFQTPVQDDVVFYASFEQPTEEGTKVYANEDLLLRWTADDRVSIFNKNTYNQQYKFNGETGDNAGGFDKVVGSEFTTGNAISHIVSVYPYQESTKISESETITVTLPAEQHYAENTFGLGANTMVSITADNYLQYKNVGGYLRVSLYGEGVSVSSITLKGNNGEKLAGKSTVTMPLDGVPATTMTNDATSEITLTCVTPVQLGATAEESTQFWFVVPPVTFSKGFTITVSGNGGVFEKATEKAVTIERNKLSKMSPIEIPFSPSGSTLKDFAQQFVGILDIWEKTIGTVSADPLHCTDNNSAWKDVHFVPIPWSGGAYSDGVDQYDPKYQPYFTMTVDGKEYTSAETWGIALRGIMDMITVEGSAKMQENCNPFEHTMGNGDSFKEPIPAVTYNDVWGYYPWYENEGPINKTELTPYLIARCASWFLARQQYLEKIGNYVLFGTGSQTYIVEEGIDGFVSPMRMWLIAARFYKYLLDNNIEENVYDAVKDVTFSTDLYGVDEMPTLKDFAQEFVKGLDVWEQTVGNVDSDPYHNSQSAQGAWTNVHYIPIGNGNNSDFKDYGNNQYDDGKEPWKLDVNGLEITSSQAWEIAIRGLMNMVTKEGESFLSMMDDRNKVYSLQDNGSLKDVMPSPSAANQWGKNPWYEGSDDERIKYYGNEIESVDVNFMVKVGAWHVVRAFLSVGENYPLGKIGNYQEFGTSSKTLNLDGYEGLISPMRELLILMRIYKYILDNNIEENVYSAIKDQKFDFDLYGIATP